MVAVPAETPVHAPVVTSIDPTPGFELDQVPPGAVGSESVPISPTHNTFVPTGGFGDGVTVSV